MTEHTHIDEKGILHKCYHECKSLLKQPAFWIGTTIGFPLEHGLYKFVWPFTLISKVMGMD